MPNCPAPADIEGRFVLVHPACSRKIRLGGRERGRGGLLHRRRLAEAVQPVAQAHDRMFPHHARPGMAHYHAGLFAAVALVTMHGAVGTRRLCPAEAAALQPRTGVIQKLAAFRAQTGGMRIPPVCSEEPRKSAGEPPALLMMVAAINPHHRRHRFPFPRQAHASQVVFCFCRGPDCDRLGNHFNRRFHTPILARRQSACFDASQSLGRFHRQGNKGEMIDLCQISGRPAGA